MDVQKDKGRIIILRHDNSSCFPSGSLILYHETLFQSFTCSPAPWQPYYPLRTGSLESLPMPHTTKTSNSLGNSMHRVAETRPWQKQGESEWVELTPPRTSEARPRVGHHRILSTLAKSPQVNGAAQAEELCERPCRLGFALGIHNERGYPMSFLRPFMYLLSSRSLHISLLRTEHIGCLTENNARTSNNLNYLDQNSHFYLIQLIRAQT